jgi:uracil-DNA glycosylase family protein
MPRDTLQDAAAFVPERPTLRGLWDAAERCEGCDLYLHATKAVMGEGPKSSQLMMVGEQPGNEEDLEGHPFAGPAGKLLDRALLEARINRAEIYLTNAVKHFKFEERGKRRLHKKPSVIEVRACRPWLEAETAVIHPQVIVCLGAIAAQSILGPDYRLTKERGKFVQHPWARYVTATVHPSSILRAPDQEQRRIQYHIQYREFVADLKLVREVLKHAPGLRRRLP